MRRLGPGAIVALALAAFAPATPAGDQVPVPASSTPAPETIAIGGRLPSGLRVLPVRGDDREIGFESLADDVRPLVVFFWSARCPVCRRYAPVVRALAKEYETRARVALVFANAAESEADVRSWLDAENVACVAAIDVRQEAATKLAAAVTPTALVFDAGGTLRYRGPIDDDRRARRRDAVEFLRAALDAVAAGKPVENPEPRAFGSAVRTRRR
jgi:thiol-disulfide isomerase/thioredoxin